MRKQSAKYCLPCVTHRSMHVASEQCSCFPSSNARCWVGRGTFCFGHGGNQLLLTTGEEILCVFDKCFLLIVCDTASLLDSRAVGFSWHVSIQPWVLWTEVLRAVRALRTFPPMSVPPVLIQTSLLVGVGWQGTSQEDSEKASPG